jgi:hypothetical protein
VRVRGTPFITAVIMSAAAMLLIPSTIESHHRHAADVSAPADATDLAADPSPSSASPSPAPIITAPPAAPARAPVASGVRTLRARTVTLSVNGFWSWALLDRHSGQIAGSPTLATRSDTASAIKIWLAADYLRRADENRITVTTTRQRQISMMIRDSDNNMADFFWKTNGGAPTIQRMIRICGLTESRAVLKGTWSTTEISARDGARMISCVVDGRGAGQRWTAFLVNEMRQVRGPGRFGIVTALAPDTAVRTAIKNGWINRSDGRWHITCLAATDDWALAVQTQYAVALGMGYGANICKQVALQLGTT